MTVVTACATATVLQTQTGKGFGGGGVGVLYEGISAHVEKAQTSSRTDLPMQLAQSILRRRRRVQWNLEGI